MLFAGLLVIAIAAMLAALAFGSADIGIAEVIGTLSGGGENGAFAAGILAAWTASGTRPEFMTVTGVSTGALAAPFAFLGSDYDDELQRLYGGLAPSRIVSEPHLKSGFLK